MLVNHTGLIGTISSASSPAENRWSSAGGIRCRTSILQHEPIAVLDARRQFGVDQSGSFRSALAASIALPQLPEGTGETTELGIVLQAYELVVGKNGPKMKESVPEVTVQEATVSSSSRIVLDPEGFPILPTGQSGYASVNGRARLQVFNETMDQLAGRISNQLDMPVINATGLAGRYDLGLYWAGRSVDATDDASPNLFSAVESQLGMRLQPRKAAVTIIVIDHVDRTPTEN